MSEWIRVEDKLPEVGVDAVWYDGNRTMSSVGLYHIDKISTDGECLINYLHNYTHWMKPEPPKS